MSENLFAILVHGQSGPFESLKRMLRELSVETYSVATCQEAASLIPQCKPHMVFTESTVADGTWLSVFNSAEAADAPLSVIVVGTFPDTKCYLSLMERGAFDFVAPPFEREPLSFVVRSAALDTLRRRGVLAAQTVGAS